MLDKIIEYQNTESKLIAKENELLRSKDREKATEIQKILKSQHAKLIELDNLAQKTNQLYLKAVEKYNQFSKKLEELEKQVDGADESKAQLYENAYKDFTVVANALEKDITSIHYEIQKISNEYEAVMKKSKVDRDNFDKYKAAYDDLKRKVEPEIENLKKSLEIQEKGVETELVKKYKSKRENRIFPVFVANLQNKCGGCRMGISATQIDEMKKSKYGIIECENCGRYIYNSEK